MSKDRFEFLAQRVQIVNDPLNVAQPLCDKYIHALTGPLLTLNHLDQFANFLERDPECLRLAYHAESRQGLFIVNPVAINEPPGTGQDATPFVISDGRGSKSDPLREYPDGEHLTFNHGLTFIMLLDRRVSSMPIKIKLCPPCPDPDCPPTECPDVEITHEHVTIGENQNIVTLTHAQWNELVARVRSGELPPV